MTPRIDIDAKESPKKLWASRSQSRKVIDLGLKTKAFLVTELTDIHVHVYTEWSKTSSIRISWTYEREDFKVVSNIIYILYQYISILVLTLNRGDIKHHIHVQSSQVQRGKEISAFLHKPLFHSKKKIFLTSTKSFAKQTWRTCICKNLYAERIQSALANSVFLFFFFFAEIPQCFLISTESKQRTTKPHTWREH